MQRERAAHEPSRPQGQRLDGIGAEMLVEPRPPDELQRIARLQKAVEASRAPAAHQAEMAAMRARQKLDDDRALAMLLDAENDAFVAPFHFPSAFIRAARADRSPKGSAGHAASPASRAPRRRAAPRAPPTQRAPFRRPAARARRANAHNSAALRSPAGEFPRPASASIRPSRTRPSGSTEPRARRPAPPKARRKQARRGAPSKTAG